MSVQRSGADTGRRDVPVGLELDGYGAHPAARTSGTPSPARLARTARAAQDAGFSFVTLAAARPGDGGPGTAGRLDPIEQLDQQRLRFHERPARHRLPGLPAGVRGDRRQDVTFAAAAGRRDRAAPAALDLPRPPSAGAVRGERAGPGGRELDVFGRVRAGGNTASSTRWSTISSARKSSGLIRAKAIMWSSPLRVLWDPLG